MFPPPVKVADVDWGDREIQKKWMKKTGRSQLGERDFETKSSKKLGESTGGRQISKDNSSKKLGGFVEDRPHSWSHVYINT